MPPELLPESANSRICFAFPREEVVENARRKALAENQVVGPRRGWGTAGAKKLRALGREILDPRMLLFVCARWEQRCSCLLRYGFVAQSLVVSGLEKQFEQ